MLALNGRNFQKLLCISPDKKSVQPIKNKLGKSFECDSLQIMHNEP